MPLLETVLVLWLLGNLDACTAFQHQPAVDVSTWNPKPIHKQLTCKTAQPYYIVPLVCVWSLRRTHDQEGLPCTACEESHPGTLCKSYEHRVLDEGFITSDST